MAEKSDRPLGTPVTSTTPSTTTEALALLTDALAAGLTDAVKRNSPQRPIPFGEYRSVSRRNPKGRPARDRQLPCQFFQNGDRIRERKLTDEELDLIPQLQPGKFCDGLVQVQQFERDGQLAFNLVYKNKELADRMALKGATPTLAVMLKRCVHEAGTGVPFGG